MNISYLTDAQVRGEYLKLLECLDLALHQCDMVDVSDVADFWKGLGYEDHEIPEY